MANIIQKSGGSTPNSKKVFYKAGEVTDKLVAGYALCYDIAEGLTPGAGEFDEMVRGNVVIQPATANLLAFAGIVKSAQLGLTLSGDTGSGLSGWVEIITPSSGVFVEAYTKANATTMVTRLVPVNGAFSLGAETWTSGTTPEVDSTDVLTVNGVALWVDDTADTSTIAANKLVMLFGR